MTYEHKMILSRVVEKEQLTRRKIKGYNNFKNIKQYKVLLPLDSKIANREHEALMEEGR